MAKRLLESLFHGSENKNAITLFYSVNGYAMNNITDDENLESANALFSNGEFTKAENTLLKLIHSNPESVEILEKLGTIALWKNDTEKAKSYFKKALKEKSWLSNYWPLNAQLKYRLASTYFRDDAFKKAAALFTEAGGPVAIGPFKELSEKGKQLALFGEETPYSIEGDAITMVEFVVLDPLPVVKMSIHDADPEFFIIDTGAEDIMLDTDYAKKNRSATFWQCACRICWRKTWVNALRQNQEPARWECKC